MRYLACLLALLFVTGCATGSFTPEERQAVMSFWAEPGRYTVTAADGADKNGPWQVRQTAEGSLWLWNYNRARGIQKGPPSQIPGALSEEQKAWESWIEAKVAMDLWNAAETARAANSKALNRPPVPAKPRPAEPGPIPAGLLLLAGDPPAFASAVTPMKFTVRLADNATITYNDQVNVRHRYAYFRFPQGVMYVGTAVKGIPESELRSLLEAAGIGPEEGRVFRSVSLLEGGFESVNTYDTGFLSVGFIQFATLSGGAGSLGAVLQKMKAEMPTDFQQEFRRYGIDVSDQGALVVVDPSTGAELVGAEAVRKIIDDKRLTAPFQSAGTRRAFRVCQLKVAKEQYYPADDIITLNLNQQVLQGRVRDFIRSEAGMATLMDRKVNTGKLDPLAEVLTEIVSQMRVSSLADLAIYEKDIVAELKYRKEYLGDVTLSQPAELPPQKPYSFSRSGRRGGRSKG